MVSMEQEIFRTGAQCCDVQNEGRSRFIEELSAEAILNGTYNLPDMDSASFTLKNGSMEHEPDDAELKRDPYAMSRSAAGEFPCVGDLEGDGRKDGALIISYQRGDFGARQHFLVAVADEQGKARQLAEYNVDASDDIKSMKILADGTIALDHITAANDYERNSLNFSKHELLTFRYDSASHQLKPQHHILKGYLKNPEVIPVR